MATIYKRGRQWYLAYILDGKRIRKHIGPYKEMASLIKQEIERRLALRNVKQILYGFSEESGGCQVCGYNLILDEHHFIPRSQNGSNFPANLIKLCPNLHRLLHFGLEVLNGNRKNKKELKEKLEKILRIDQDFALFYQRNAAQFEKMKEYNNKKQAQ